MELVLEHQRTAVTRPVGKRVQVPRRSVNHPQLEEEPRVRILRRIGRARVGERTGLRVAFGKMEPALRFGTAVWPEDRFEGEGLEARHRMLVDEQRITD